MVNTKTRLKINDNSGAIIAECIKIYRFSRYNNACVGDYILTTIKKAVPGRKVKKSQMHRVLITQERRPIVRKDGTILKFDQCSGIILKDFLPIATRMDKVIPIEVRYRGYIKVVSMASSVV